MQMLTCSGFLTKSFTDCHLPALVPPDSPVLPPSFSRGRWTQSQGCGCPGSCCSLRSDCERRQITSLCPLSTHSAKWGGRKPSSQSSPEGTRWLDMTAPLKLQGAAWIPWQCGCWWGWFTNTIGWLERFSFFWLDEIGETCLLLGVMTPRVGWSQKGTASFNPLFLPREKQRVVNHSFPFSWAVLFPSYRFYTFLTSPLMNVIVFF